MALETVSLSRDGGVDEHLIGSIHTDAHGELDIERGPVVEHLRNTDRGLEQSFRIAKRPVESGALEVRVRVAGLDYAGATEGGLHFSDPRTGLGFRYGVATWIDARGAKTTIHPAFEHGHVVVRVPAALVEASAFPVLLDPLVSPEIGMDAPVIGPASGDQTAPAVAFDGSEYLVVWHDVRGSDGRTRGTRVATDGTVLDPTSLSIVPEVESSAPSVAWGGGVYLVTAPSPFGGIVGARVTAQGAVLDSNGFTILTGEPEDTDVAFDGTNFLVVDDDFDDPFPDVTTIEGAFVTPSGAVLPPITISPVLQYNALPNVAFDGTNYLVIWQTDNAPGNGIQGAQVAPDGSVLDIFSVASAAQYQNRIAPALAFGGGDFLVAWTEEDWDPASNTIVNPGIRAARVAPDTTILDTPPIDVADGLPGLNVSSVLMPSVAFDGSKYLVAWRDSGGSSSSSVRAARVDVAGSVLDPAGITVTTSGDSARVGSDGMSFFVVYNAGSADADVFGRRVADDGTVLDASGVLLAGRRRLRTMATTTSLRGRAGQSTSPAHASRRTVRSRSRRGSSSLQQRRSRPESPGTGRRISSCGPIKALPKGPTFAAVA